ncbi:MAG: hypothetical protein ACLP1Q_05800 [Solirubrobacteraceae bacterium]
MASTSRILHFGQVECAISTSREISTDQPVVSGSGSEVVLPVCETFVKQPFAFVQAAIAYSVSKVARLASMSGSS